MTSRSPLAPAAALPLALALALALAGCLRVGPGEDLHLVCERESTSPWHPYAPSDLAVVTRIEGPVTMEQRDRLLTDAADRLLTMGAAPYEAFESRLYPIGGGVWRFDANGTVGNATDVYELELPPLNETVFAPTHLWTRAHESARGASVVEGPATTVSRATWEPDLAGCIRLEYADGTTVWVNVDKGQVVDHTG